MNILSQSLEKNLSEIKKRLPSEDILSYSFETADKTACAIIYADGIVNKELLGDLIARPLSKLNLQGETHENPQNEGGRYASKLEIIQKAALFPELKEKEIAELTDILKSETKIRNIIIKELKAVADKYGKERKTTLVFEHQLMIYVKKSLTATAYC